MSSCGMYVVRDPEINRLLAREAVAAYREGREPDFAQIVNRDSSSINGVRYLTKYRARNSRQMHNNFDPTLN